MRTLSATLLVACLFAVSNAFAEDATGGLKDFGKAVFSEVERKLILDFYQSRYGGSEYRDHDRDRHDGPKAGKKDNKAAKGKGKGKGNPKGLPPGIQKKLERGGELPPGIAKKHLPDDLQARMPPVREGYERAEIDGEIVLIDIASQKIADVIRRSATKTSRELFD